jgi:polysaccharide export outer membrane protein
MNFLFTILIMWASASSPVAAEDVYRLGSGDSIRVQVYGHPDMGREMAIPERCAVDLPFVGAVPVCGRSTAQAASDIRARLADGYLVNPEVVVDLVEYGSQRVVVKGAVKTPGVQVLRGLTSLSEVIASAGGPSEENVFEVVVLGEDNATKTYLLSELDRAVGVKSGDTVILNHGLFVFVHGEVEKEGAVPFRSGLTVTQALSFAGGMTEYAGRKVRIVRANGEKVRVNISRIHRGLEADYVMEPADKLIIQRSLF